MAKFIDLTGQRFGKLTVIGRHGYTKDKKILWLCKCDCGNTTLSRKSNLVSGNTTSCGCARNIIDLKGKKFGRLTVIERADDHISANGRHFIRWKCRCDCGNISYPYTGKLLSGDTVSCGCLFQEKCGTYGLKHGKLNTRLYRIWHGIKQRCLDANCVAYSRYGGRGITVCDEWRNDFQVFYDWAMANGYSDNLSVDRINNDGNYEPSNCRWATAKEQANNRRKRKTKGEQA